VPFFVMLLTVPNNYQRVVIVTVMANCVCHPLLLTIKVWLFFTVRPFAGTSSKITTSNSCIHLLTRSMITSRCCTSECCFVAKPITHTQFLSMQHVCDSMKGVSTLIVQDKGCRPMEVCLEGCLLVVRCRSPLSSAHRSTNHLSHPLMGCLVDECKRLNRDKALSVESPS
jgi:hypothetical protein